MGLVQKFCGWMLYRVMGWKKNVTVEHPDKYIICLVPHTSNWDFVIGQLYCRAEGFRINYLMKKEWFFWPLGPIFRATGGIPVFRDKKMKMTERLALTAKESKEFRLTITPEGTRKPNPDWKKGFYIIAEKAQIPILLYGCDFEKKLIQCTVSYKPTGDMEKEIAEIKQYFKDFKGKHPENFAI